MATIQEFIITGLSSGIATTALIGLACGIFKKTISQYLAKQHTEEISRLQSSLKRIESKFSIYSQNQFDAYLKLWRKLIELKFLVLPLYVDAANQKSFDDFENFKAELFKTTIELESLGIILGDEHFNKFMGIISAFDKVEFSNKVIQGWKCQAGADEDTVRQYIDRNLKQIHNAKMECLDKIKYFRNIIRKHLFVDDKE